MRQIHFGASAVALVLAIAACSSTSSDDSATTISTASATATPSANEFTLRGDGLGAFDFGSSGTPVLEALLTAFGTPHLQDLAYPLPNPDESESAEFPFTSEDGVRGFRYPLALSACWPRLEFCITLGGNDAVGQVFTGWQLRGVTDAPLATASGATSGSSAADYPSIELFATSGCDSIGLQDGGGTLDGITLLLLSSGAPFGGFNADGEYIESIPPLDELRITAMEAGDSPSLTDDGCS